MMNKKVMHKIPVLTAIKNLQRPVFTTHEIAISSGGSVSNVIQALNHLSKKGVVLKISRGIWALDIGSEKISPYQEILDSRPGKSPDRLFVYLCPQEKTVWPFS